MSVAYTCYVIPELQSVAYGPSGRDVMAVTNLLIDLKWTKATAVYTVRSDFEGNRKHSDISAPTMAADLDSLMARGRAFVVELPEVPDTEWWPDAFRDADGQSRKYEFTDQPSGLLEPQYCFGGRLCWSPSLFSVPQDNINGDTPTPCPACDADVLVGIGKDDPALRALTDADFFMSVPTRCPSCAAALTPAELTMQFMSGITGERIPERAPFGRFMIALDAPSPGQYPHPIEERLLARLRETLGIAYRNVGRWQ